MPNNNQGGRGRSQGGGNQGGGQRMSHRRGIMSQGNNEVQKDPETGRFLPRGDGQVRRGMAHRRDGSGGQVQHAQGDNRSTPEAINKDGTPDMRRKENRNDPQTVAVMRGQGGSVGTSRGGGDGNNNGGGGRSMGHQRGAAAMQRQPASQMGNNSGGGRGGRRGNQQMQQEEEQYDNQGQEQGSGDYQDLDLDTHLEYIENAKQILIPFIQFAQAIQETKDFDFAHDQNSDYFEMIIPGDDQQGIEELKLTSDDFQALGNLPQEWPEYFAELQQEQFDEQGGGDDGNQ